MKLYSDTELDNDIKYVKEMFTQCGNTYRDIGENFKQLNKTISGRINFIMLQFKNLFSPNKMFI